MAEPMTPHERKEMLEEVRDLKQKADKAEEDGDLERSARYSMECSMLMLLLIVDKQEKEKANG